MLAVLSGLSLLESSCFEQSLNEGSLNSESAAVLVLAVIYGSLGVPLHIETLNCPFFLRDKLRSEARG